MQDHSLRTKIIVVLLIWLATAALAAVLIAQRGTRSIDIAAGPRGGEAFLLAEAIAAELREQRPYIEVQVLETNGSAENVALLERGQVEFATAQADVDVSPSTRLVGFLYPDVFQLLVREDAGIESFHDLVGKRVATPLQVAAQYGTFWFLARHYEVDRQELVALPMTDAAADFALAEGYVDAIFRVRAPGNPGIQALIERHPMRLVPIRHGAALALKRPTLGPGSIPEGSYRGYPPVPEADLPTVSLQRLLIASKDLDDRLVRSVTAILFEQRTALVARTPLAGFISEPDEGARIAMPIHSGALDYYNREKPAFWKENARVMAPIFYMLALAGSALLALRARLVRKQKARADRYNQRLVELAHSARETHSRDELFEIKDRLLEMLQNVVMDLDNDRFAQEEFTTFAFYWQAVDTVIRDRLADLPAQVEEAPA